jgi:hypothetical protein
MTPQAKALYDELEAFVEKTRGNKNYCYTPQGIKEFIEIKTRHSQEAFDELMTLRIKIKGHNQGTQ